MNYSQMYSFLSEDNVKRHLGFMRELTAKRSIIEKSIPALKGVGVGELVKMNTRRSVKNELLPLLLKIDAHRLYFSSFRKDPTPSEPIRRYYGSENSFCYEMREAARGQESGYLYVYKDQRGRPQFKVTDSLDVTFIKDSPNLLIDLFEHAYFADYAYSFGEYLKNALAHLDFSRLDGQITP